MDEFVTIPLWPAKSPILQDGSNDDYMPVMEFYRSSVSVPDASRRRPAMVIFPGGAYSHRAVHEGHDVALCFNAMGFNCFVVEYRVSPHRFPAPQQDAFRAIQLVRANADEYGIDPEQVATIGFSAGGHLSASTATLFDDPLVDFKAGDKADEMNRRPDACGLGYPVIVADYRLANHFSFRMLLGDSYRERWSAYGLDSRITADTPPTFLWHTADDGGVNYKNSMIFAERMRELGLTVELHIFPHGHHGLGLATDFPDIAQWPHLYRSFLRTSLHFNC